MHDSSLIRRAHPLIARRDICRLYRHTGFLMTGVSHVAEVSVGIAAIALASSSILPWRDPNETLEMPGYMVY